MKRCKICGLKNDQLVKRCTNDQWAKMKTINSFVSSAIDNDAGLFDTPHFNELANLFPGYPNDLKTVRVVIPDSLCQGCSQEHNEKTNFPENPKQIK